MQLRPPNATKERSPRVGDRLQVLVDRLSLGGEGVGRVRGHVVFVPYACPGDELEVEITARYPRYVRGRICRVLKPSPHRIAPPCPYHFQVDQPRTLFCGGCTWQQLAYDAQLEAKRRVVQETLERIGKLRGVSVQPTLGMADPWRYRNKVQQPVGWDGHRIISGFYAPHSHRIVPLEDCLVQPELSVAILNRTKALLEQYGLKPYDTKTQGGWVRHLLVRMAQARALLAFVTRTPQFPHEAQVVSTLRNAFPALIGIHQNVNPASTNVILGPQWRTLYGGDTLEERLGPLRLRVSPSSFFQVNTPQTEVLCQVIQGMVGKGGGTLLDLYCGVGSIGLFLAAQFQEVVGVEEVENAVQDARGNALLNSIGHARFYAEPVERFLSRYQRTRESVGPLTVVLDPPRAGCSSRVLDAVRTLQPAQLVYVSCDPGTLARDLDVLQASFQIKTVQPVDLFPQTAHIEAIVHLAKGDVVEG